MPVLHTKLVAFALSSAIIGVAGVLFAFPYLRTVEPAGFNRERSFDVPFIIIIGVLFTIIIGVLFTIIIGGLATIRAAFPGAALIVAFPLVLSRLGALILGGIINYMNLINISDGGVNGVKLTWDECETEYAVEKGVECYQRQKSHAATAAWNPLAVGIAYAMIDGETADDVPLITVNHGRTDTTDGRVLPCVFTLLLNPCSKTSGIIDYVAGKAGGLDKLKGKKIVVLYHGSPHGKKTIPIHDLLAAKYGFTVDQIEVPHPGSEQGAPWLQIGRAHPDRVVLRGWGVMNPVALTTAPQWLPGRPYRRQRLVELGRGYASCG